MSKGGPIHVFDLTIKKDQVPRTILHEYLVECGKHYVYQLEKSESGYVHWQVRLSLKSKTRAGTFVKQCNAVFGSGFGDVSPTSNGEAAKMIAHGRAFYTMKAETRIEGPWSDKDKKPRYVQKRFKNATLKDWQLLLKARIDGQIHTANDRHIILVVDKSGNNGKSWFKGYMYSHYGAVVLPSSLPSVNDAIQLLCSNKDIGEGWHGTVLMDVPRATSQKHWWTLAAGLETIKQGFLYDTRYTYTEKVIEPPALVVFCNTEPPEGCMSEDVFKRFIIN